MLKNTQRNWRLAGYLLIEIGGGFLFGVALALAACIQVIEQFTRQL